MNIKLFFAFFLSFNFCYAAKVPKDTLFSVKSGKLSDKYVWNKRLVPDSNYHLVIRHLVTQDVSVRISGITISDSGTLQLIRSKSIVLESTNNIIVDGKLILNPTSSSILNTIRFININEDDFVGGGMDILDSDVGLWVRRGTVQMLGAKKTPWTRLYSQANVGDTVIKVLSASGWRIGDSISIAPMSNTATPGYFLNFSIRKIKSIKSNSITLDSPLSYSHEVVTDPINGAKYTAEVMNLSRNVTIEGTPSGKSHIIFLMSNGVQMIKWVGIQHMGPRRGPPGKSNDILGRYSLHSHHCVNGIRGSEIEGVVVLNGGSHSYVIHASNGVELKNCVSFNTYEDAFWWDFPPENSSMMSNDSHDNVYDSCLAALIKSDPFNRGYNLSGFVLSGGTGNTVKNCVVVGNQGTSRASAFNWSEKLNYKPNIWIFQNNYGHNNRGSGLFTWQNDTSNHVVDGFIGFNNGRYGIEHGAYHNAYHYRNMNLFNNSYGILLHATAMPKNNPFQYGYTSSFINIKSADSLFITVHTLPGTPTLFFSCRFPGILVSELPARVANPPAGLFDFVNCGLNKSNFSVIGMEASSVIRVQNGNEAFQLTHEGFKDIEPFWTLDVIWPQFTF